MGTLFRCLALVIFAGVAFMAGLHRAEPPQRLPLIHAGLSICAPVGPQEGQGDAADSDEANPAPGAQMPALGNQGPAEAPRIA